LDFLGIDFDCDGSSFLNLIKGGLPSRNVIYTQLNEFSDGKRFLMRCSIDRNFCYVLNLSRHSYPFASVDVDFVSLTKELKVEQRSKMLNRNKQELYDLREDPFAQKDLSNDGSHICSEKLERLIEFCKSIGDDEVYKCLMLS